MKHAGSNDPGTLLALFACCVPCLFVMIPGWFVDNGIFCRTGRAGEPDNIPASGSGNFRFYRVFYHCYKDSFMVFSQGWTSPWSRVRSMRIKRVLKGMDAPGMGDFCSRFTKTDYYSTSIVLHCVKHDGFNCPGCWVQKCELVVFPIKPREFNLTFDRL